MRFGAHQYIFTERWSDQSLGVLDQAKSLGLDVLELSTGDDVRFDARATARHAESLGLGLVLGPGGVWPMECDISDDDADNRRKGFAWHQAAIDLAAELGAAAYTGAIYGHPGRVHRRPSPPDEYPRTAENLHRLSEYARCRGLHLVIEPMSHFRTHMVNTPEQAMRLIALADHPNLHVLLDTYHLATEIRDYGRAVRTAASRLWGVHACENDRGAPGGGIIPWQPFLSALVAHRPDAFVILEAYNSSVPGFALSRGQFHDVCPDADDFVRSGIGFLKLSLSRLRSIDSLAEPISR